MTPVSAVISLLTAAAVVALIVWFGKRCLDELAQTSDLDLRYFTRNAWALLIIFAFPIGPTLYLLYAKGPRRYL